MNLFNQTYTLNEAENKLFQKVTTTEYMVPVIKIIENYLKVDKSDNIKVKWQNIFDQISSIMKEAQPIVEEYILSRVSNGKIQNADQARRSIVGYVFPYTLIYIFLNNKLIENIEPHIYITNLPSQVEGFEKIATIYAGAETQKPDVDIVIYSRNPKTKTIKYIIMSVKTSLRERAGQTYKWKLLMEIATTENTIKDKYDIKYEVKNLPLICFVTADFYNEIDSPQLRGMFKFFDKSFVAKPIDKELIVRLSNLVSFVNEHLGIKT